MEHSQEEAPESGPNYASTTNCPQEQSDMLSSSCCTQHVVCSGCKPILHRRGLLSCRQMNAWSSGAPSPSDGHPTDDLVCPCTAESVYALVQPCRSALRAVMPGCVVLWAHRIMCVPRLRSEPLLFPSPPSMELLTDINPRLPIVSALSRSRMDRARCVM